LNEAQLKAATSRFLIEAFADATPKAPSWGESVAMALHEDAPPTDSLARGLMLHPAWLARAYRVWRGEGMAETVRRRRVERAMLALRGSLTPLAQVAAESGFCDQGHMNRAFRAVLGRTPLEVRCEAALLAPIS
jgi:AraC family transcriptional regulator